MSTPDLKRLCLPCSIDVLVLAQRDETSDGCNLARYRACGTLVWRALLPDIGGRTSDDSVDAGLSGTAIEAVTLSGWKVTLAPEAGAIMTSDVTK